MKACHCGPSSWIPQEWRCLRHLFRLERTWLFAQHHFRLGPVGVRYAPARCCCDPCQSFSCTPTAVYDGDGPIWCAEGPRIRAAGIAARAADGTCRANHPCPPSTALRFRGALVRLLGGPRGTLKTGQLKPTNEGDEQKHPKVATPPASGPFLVGGLMSSTIAH